MRVVAVIPAHDPRDGFGGTWGWADAPGENADDNDWVRLGAIQARFSDCKLLTAPVRGMADVFTTDPLTEVVPSIFSLPLRIEKPPDSSRGFSRFSYTERDALMNFDAFLASAATVGYPSPKPTVAGADSRPAANRKKTVALPRRATHADVLWAHDRRQVTVFLATLEPNENSPATPLLLPAARIRRGFADLRIIDFLPSQSDACLRPVFRFHSASTESPAGRPSSFLSPFSLPLENLARLGCWDSATDRNPRFSIEFGRLDYETLKYPPAGVSARLELLGRLRPHCDCPLTDDELLVCSKHDALVGLARRC